MTATNFLIAAILAKLGHDIFLSGNFMITLAAMDETKKQFPVERGKRTEQIRILPCAENEACQKSDTHLVVALPVYHPFIKRTLLFRAESAAINASKAQMAKRTQLDCEPCEIS